MVVMISRWQHKALNGSRPFHSFIVIFKYQYKAHQGNHIPVNMELKLAAGVERS